MGRKEKKKKNISMACSMVSPRIIDTPHEGDHFTTSVLGQYFFFLSGSCNAFMFFQYSFSAENESQVLHKTKGYLRLYEKQIGGWVKSIDLGSDSGLPLSLCGLSTLLNLSGSQLHRLGNAGRNSTCWTAPWWRAREFMEVKRLEQCVTYNEHCVCICYCSRY